MCSSQSIFGFFCSFNPCTVPWVRESGTSSIGLPSARKCSGAKEVFTLLAMTKRWWPSMRLSSKGPSKKRFHSDTCASFTYSL